MILIFRFYENKWVYGQILKKDDDARRLANGCKNERIYWIGAKKDRKKIQWSSKSWAK